MNNIDSIREDYNIGDPIRISCSLGIKEGFIVAFMGDKIKIQPYDKTRKPIYISDATITDVEEGSIPQAVRESTIAESSADSSDSVQAASDETKQVSAIEELPNEEDKKIESPITKETTPLLVPENSDEKKSPESNTDTKPKDEVKEKPTQGIKSLSGGKRVTLKSFQDLATLDGVKEIREKDASNFVRETGKIERAGYGNFGFILDSRTGDELFFTFSELLDFENVDPSSLRGQYVIYTRSRNLRGPVAIAIHKPNTIENLVKLAKEKFEQGQKGAAYEIVNHIIYEYPDSPIANEALSSFARKKKPTPKPAVSKNAEGFSPLYKKARELHEAKEYDKAVEAYKKAIKYNQKAESAVKDLGMLLVFLSKKSTDPTEGLAYLSEARTLLETYKKLLPENSETTMSYLENFYYSIRDFAAFKDIAHKLLESLDEKKDGPRYVFLLNKLAAVYVKEGNTDKARELVNKALEIYPASSGASSLLSIIDAPSTKIDERIEEEIETYDSPNTDFEAFNDGVSAFIEETLDKYDDFDGVKEKDRGNFTLKTLSDVRALIKTFDDKKFAGRPSERARYLLTEGKLMQLLDPDNTFGLRSVMARYCNDMAKIHIYNGSSIDVIRFYYSESFALEEKYYATAQQASYYLLTNIYEGKKLQDEINKSPSVDSVLKLVLSGPFDARKWESILTLFLYNKQIFVSIVGKLFENKDYFKQSLEAFKHFGIRAGEISNLESYKNVWNQLRQKRLEDYRITLASLKSISSTNNVEELSIRLSENLLSILRDWMCHIDVVRVQSIHKTIAPALDKYHKASGFRNKQLNCHEAENLISELQNDIYKLPTKLSYEGILPLLAKALDSLHESYDSIVASSKPTPKISLLRANSVVDQQLVPLQIEVSIDKDSSPIYNVSLEIVNNEEIQTTDNESATAYLGLIEGGDSHIFKRTVKVSDYVIEKKAIAFDVKCSYINAGESNTITSSLALHLYNPEDFKQIPNKYAAVAESGPLSADSEMFYGQKRYIKSVVDTIIESPSKQVIIYGQKRSGKSSVLNRVEQELTAAGAFCVQFSMGKIVRNMSEVAFYYKILSEIDDSLEALREEGKVAPDFSIPTRSEFQSEDMENPLETFTKYMRQFKRACQRTEGWKDRRLVVLIDEFTYMYGAIKLKRISPTIMMQWKAITQDEKAQFSAVLVGQDVVPAFKNEPYARNAFGVIKDIRLSYLDEDDARDLIVKPILDNGSSRYSDKAVELIMDYTACNPYYIQIFCSYLVNFMNEKHYNNVTEADVLDVASSLITGVKALDPAKFENLLSSGETDNEDDSEGTFVDDAIKSYSDEQVETVLMGVAKASSTKVWASRGDIVTSLDFETEEGILDQLYNRDVLDRKDDKLYYRIKVRLYKEWLLKH